MIRNQWEISKRLRRFLTTSPSVFGYKWVEECGNWKVFVIKVWDAYKNP